MRRIALILLVLLGAGPALADDPPVRLIDRWSGIVFYCAPDFDQPWTTAACGGIAEGVVRQAGEAGIKVALLDMTGESQWMEKSAAAGFDGGNALSMLFQFKGSDRPGGNTALDLNMQVPVAPKPGVSPTQWALLFTQTTTIDPGSTTTSRSTLRRPSSPASSNL